MLALAPLAALLLATARADTEVGIKLKAECGAGALSFLNITKFPENTPADAEQNRQKYQEYRDNRAFTFNFDRVFVEPARPQIPGCFNLTAYNVSVSRPLQDISAEFHMTIGGSRPTFEAGKNLPCKAKRETPCACGAQNSCMYCDFCRDFNSIQVTKKAVATPTRRRRDANCKCDIQPGQYDFRTEVCTPDREELERALPSEIFSYVDNSASFTLWTTLYVYTTRFDGVAADAIAETKRASLGGCAVIGTDLSFN